MMVLTNSKASGNNIVASADTLIHKGMFTRMDLDLYEFQGDFSMHTKAMLVDRDLSAFGSFNFDMRSAYIDTELMLVIRSESRSIKCWRSICSQCARLPCPFKRTAAMATVTALSPSRFTGPRIC